MSSSILPPDSRLDARTVLDSLRDYLEQLREEGIEGLPGTLKPVRAEGKPLPLSAARPQKVAEAPERRLTLQRESAEHRVAIGAGIVPVREKTASEIGARTESGDDKKAADAPIVAESVGAAGASPAELFYRYPGLEKTANLDELRTFIGECTRCKLAPMRTNLVFGVGNLNADLMFVGEAPGADEDARGEPFVGRAGQLLTDIIERGMGLTRADVYICNVIKCRPPGNRNPENDEVASCEPFLFRQIDLVKPRAIVGLGTFAVQALLKVKTPISKLRGNWHEVRGVKLMPTFHPAYLLRNPGDKRLVWADIQLVMKMLGMPITNRGRT
ncbi:MAG TPA: uracil-DNA glycosylase [Candidatus Binataceae bacterium]|nr:uracil-DNA glycosylase [Candidatus Binataceae bacterium]